MMFALLDMFLFYTPSAHIRELKGIWVDKTINYARWVGFSNTLNNEWNGFTIYVSGSQDQLIEGTHWQLI